ncbi:MAG: trypsin-like peptidase domain-containing protein [Paracoccaceae bacterium]
MRILLAVLIGLLPNMGFAETRVPNDRLEISLGFAPVVREVAPAVVNIYAKRVTEVRRRSLFSDDPFFKDFFQNFDRPRSRVQNSLGSGVILGADGIVVSNYHVVGQATDIRVVLNDRREYSARVLLGDKGSDLAILQLDQADALPYLGFRDSNTVEVGELVLALGNPFGVGQTVSSGIVSGLARSGGAGGAGRGYFIQTDAPINPGNSGGALVDVNGDLIGVNTRILTRSGGSNGIGFAIPANLVKAFVEQARAGNTRFVQPWAGLSGQSVEADMTEMLGLNVPEGIILSGIHPQSPFVDQFKVGDVITEIDGMQVNAPPEMLFHMAVKGEGRDIRVTRIRDGLKLEIDVRLIAPPETPDRATLVLDNGRLLPGLTIERINPAVIAERNLPFDAAGVVVTELGQLGARVGLRQGDVLVSIMGQEVIAPEDVFELLPKGQRRTVVSAVRGNRRITLRF